MSKQQKKNSKKSSKNKSSQSRTSGKYPLIEVYGKFFNWEQQRIREAQLEAKDDEAPDDAVVKIGKNWVTRSNAIWSPNLLMTMNEVLPVG